MNFKKINGNAAEKKLPISYYSMGFLFWIHGEWRKYMYLLLYA